MKLFPAIVASLITAIVTGAVMLVIGINALFTPNQVAAADAPPADSSPAVTSVQAVSDKAGTSAGNEAAQIQQLQQRVTQYQDREKQFQAQLNKARQELNQAQQQMSDAATQIQQYQMLLQALQERGIIQINQDGSISIPRGFQGFDDGEGH